MNWISKNNFVKGIIITLFVINVATVAVMWIYITGDKKPPEFEVNNRPPEPVGLLQKEIGLSDEQTQQVELMRKKNFEKGKNTIGKMIELRRKLSENLFTEKPDTNEINSVLKEIGLLQSQIEKSRFDDFKLLVSICTKEQIKKLEPILKEVIVGIPPFGRSMGRPGMINVDRDGFRQMPPPGERRLKPGNNPNNK